MESGNVAQWVLAQQVGGPEFDTLGKKTLGRNKTKKFKQFYLFMCMCVSSLHHCAYVEVRGQFARVSSPLLGLKSGPQAWCKVP